MGLALIVFDYYDLVFTMFMTIPYSFNRNPMNYYRLVYILHSTDK